MVKVTQLGRAEQRLEPGLFMEKTECFYEKACALEAINHQASHANTP